MPLVNEKNEGPEMLCLACKTPLEKTMLATTDFMNQVASMYCPRGTCPRYGLMTALAYVKEEEVRSPSEKSPGEAGGNLAGTTPSV